MKFFSVWNLCYPIIVLFVFWIWNLLFKLKFAFLKFVFCWKANLLFLKNKFAHFKTQIYPEKGKISKTQICFLKDKFVFQKSYLCFVWIDFQISYLCFETHICVLKSKFVFYMNWFSDFILVFWKINLCLELFVFCIWDLCFNLKFAFKKFVFC